MFSVVRCYAVVGYSHQDKTLTECYTLSRRIAVVLTYPLWLVPSAIKLNTFLAGPIFIAKERLGTNLLDVPIWQSLDNCETAI